MACIPIRLVWWVLSAFKELPQNSGNCTHLREFLATFLMVFYHNRKKTLLVYNIVGFASFS